MLSTSAGVRSVLWRAADIHGSRDPHELCERADAHLLHDARPVNLDRLDDGAQVSGNLFIESTCNDMREYFALARGERRQTFGNRKAT